jgi:hypothetical protein
VESEARFKVRFLMIPVYRYEHDAREIWEGHCLQRIESNTFDNGKHLALIGQAQGADLIVTTESRQDTLSGCVMSFAYWDTRILQARKLLNPQNGEYLDVDITPMGTESIAVGERTVDARRYRLQGKDLLIDLWYSPDQQWLALQSTVESGRTLHYRRQ